MEQWEESNENLTRTFDDRPFDFRKFKGYTNSRGEDEMPSEYDANADVHAKETIPDIADLDIDTLRHNIMRSYLEVSEWLGDGAELYGSHNGYVSRKMSLAWLFNAIRALINWKMDNQGSWAEADIHPLVVDGTNDIRECFLDDGQFSTQHHDYGDYEDLDQINGCCAPQYAVRANEPWKNGTLKVRGNEWHYGERAWFWTHTSFIGECRFFHNARFLG